MKTAVWIRILAVLVALSTLYFLVAHALDDGVRAMHFIPDIIVSAGLLIAAAQGGRAGLLAAYAAAFGVFLTFSVGTYWTEGLAATPIGAALGAVACGIMIAFLLRAEP